MTQAVVLAQQASTGVSQGFKNRIINGAMVIAQRTTSAITVDNTENFPVDRTNVRCNASGLSATTQQSTSVVPSNFRNSIAINVTTGAASGSIDRGYMLQKIEGVNVADFLLGTASAVAWTFSFWVRSSLTGTFSGSFQNEAQNRSYVFTYTINAANTWEQKSITVTGDTTGTWITGTGSGLFVTLDCGNGSSLRSSTTGSWIVGDFRGATGSTSLFANSGATFYTTGWQLEIGTVATSFDYRPYGTELALCQRYYFKTKPPAFSVISTGGYNSSTTAFQGFLQYPVTMRTSPTALEQSGTAGHYEVVNQNGATTCSSVPTYIDATDIMTRTQFTVSSGLTGGSSGSARTNNANGFLAWSAEL